MRERRGDIRAEGIFRLRSGASRRRGHLYEVIRLGVPYAALREALASLRARGRAVTGFGDMSAEEIAALTGLPLDQAAMAKEREFDEPFLMEGDERDRAEIVKAVERWVWP